MPYMLSSRLMLFNVMPFTGLLLYYRLDNEAALGGEEARSLTDEVQHLKEQLLVRPHTHTHTHTHIHRHTRTYTHTHIHVHTHVPTHTHTHMCYQVRVNATQEAYKA